MRYSYQKEGNEFIVFDNKVDVIIARYAPHYEKLKLMEVGILHEKLFPEFISHESDIQKVLIKLNLESS